MERLINKFWIAGCNGISCRAVDGRGQVMHPEHVVAKGSSSGEAHVTLRAYVRLLAGVTPDVPGQVTLSTQDSAAYRTRDM